MDEAKNESEQSNVGHANSAEPAVVETVARKVGSAVGAIAAKVAGASKKSRPGANAYEERRRQIQKKKKLAHRRRLKGSHTKG